MAGQKKNDDTYARFNGIAVQFIRQFVHESPRTDLVDLAYEDLGRAAIEWFLGCHKRWSPDYVRLLANALSQWADFLRRTELVPSVPIENILDRLVHHRPEAKPRQSERRKSRRKQAAGKKSDSLTADRGRRPSAKSIKPRDLRRLIKYFRDKGDRFSLWIAGYLQLASRIGWRPGEMFAIWLDGKYLCAPAEKNTNGRGLCSTCEIGLHEYPASLVEKLDVWISEMPHWLDKYEGRWKLEDVMNKRIVSACGKLGIPPICLYTLRHFAVASMKATGLTREEIAVIINHASTRTATERYGKARSGRKWPKKMFRIDPWRLTLVRSNARKFSERKSAPDEPAAQLPA